ncbi:MAG: hypothetical protein ACKV2Q_00460 [Planctomycetaceae bacterium]
MSGQQLITGDGSHLPSKADAKLVRQAIRQRWPVSKAMRSEVLEIAQKVMRSAGHARDITACLKIILEADKINIAATKLDQPPTGQPVNVGVAVNGVTAAQVAAELVLSGNWRKVLECDDAAAMSTAEASL